MAFRLVPCAATSYGSWHPRTRTFLNECARCVPSESAGALPGASHVKAALLARWVSKLGIATWRQHIAMLRRCVPTMEAGALDRPLSDGPGPVWQLPLQCVACDEADADPQ